MFAYLFKSSIFLINLENAIKATAQEIEPGLTESGVKLKLRLIA